MIGFIADITAIVYIHVIDGIIVGCQAFRYLTECDIFFLILKPHGFSRDLIIYILLIQDEMPPVTRAHHRKPEIPRFPAYHDPVFI